jgi:hypothetical protein
MIDDLKLKRGSITVALCDTLMRLVTFGSGAMEERKAWPWSERALLQSPLRCRPAVYGKVA